MTEKLRAILEQQKHAIWRDLYDIYYLLEQRADCDHVCTALPNELEVKNLSIKTVTVEWLVELKTGFETDWSGDLVQLVPGERMRAFKSVWQEVLRYAQENTWGRELITAPVAGQSEAAHILGYVGYELHLESRESGFRT